MLDDASFHWPGVVVVGGGVSGLLTAFELDRRGLPVLVIEQTALCSGQTGQCHGWLHRGAIFADAEPTDFEQLNRGADWWARLAENSATVGNQFTCDLGGRHGATCSSVAAVWRNLGQHYTTVEPRNDAYAWTLRGPECAIVPIDVLRAALTGSPIVIRSGRAVELRPSPSQRSAEAVVVATGQRLVTIRAEAFVIACGSGITGILPDPRVGSRLTERLSFMLVVRSAAVPGSALAVPEQDALGLLAVPRIRDGVRILLVSNFMSYAPSVDISYARANWLAGVRPTLATYLPAVWTETDALWGVYPAVKVEPARELALGVAGSAVLHTAFDNVWAGVPGKLVLAPILAEQLADHVAEYLPKFARAASAQNAGTLLASLPMAHWGPEEWEVTPLVRRQILFSE